MEKTFSSSLAMRQCSSSKAPMGWKTPERGFNPRLPPTLQRPEPPDFAQSPLNSFHHLVLHLK